MSRKPRVDFPGAWHHVMHRGARRAPIFVQDAHILLFLEILERVVAEHGIEVHAYALMPNHYHLIVRSLRGNLSESMKMLNGVYAQRLNLLNKWDGPVFRGRFRSQLIADDSYLIYLLAYIHLNPLKAGLATRLDEHCWTSHLAYVGLELKPAWLSCVTLQRRFVNTAALHDFVKALREGSEDWPEEIQLDSGIIKGPPSTDPATRAEQIIEAKLLSKNETLYRIYRITGADHSALMRRERGPRSNPARRFAVWALRHSAGLRHREIAEIMNMSEAQVAKILNRIAHKKTAPLKEWMLEWRA